VAILGLSNPVVGDQRISSPCKQTNLDQANGLIASHEAGIKHQGLHQAQLLLNLYRSKFKLSNMRVWKLMFHKGKIIKSI